MRFPVVLLRSQRPARTETKRFRKRQRCRAPSAVGIEEETKSSCRRVEGYEGAARAHESRCPPTACSSLRRRTSRDCFGAWRRVVRSRQGRKRKGGGGAGAHTGNCESLRGLQCARARKNFLRGSELPCARRETSEEGERGSEARMPVSRDDERRTVREPRGAREKSPPCVLLS